MAVTFADCGFRDIAGKLIVVECPLLKRLGQTSIIVPDGADSILAYGYIDHEQGLSLFGLAPASFESGTIYNEESFPAVQNQLVLLRSGSIPPAARVLFPDDAEELGQHYSEEIGQLEKGHVPSDGVLATRGIDQIDAFRSPEYPDDVSAVLASDELTPEVVWFRLEGITEDGMLAGMLLNEPDSDYPVHEGDLMALDFTKAEDGSPFLVTVPDLLISRAE